MRKDIRFVICLVVIMLLALLCIYRILADKEIEDENRPQVTNGAPSPTERTIIVSNGANSNLVLGTIRFYTVKLSGRLIESVEVAVGQNVEVTPKLITEYITDALEDEEIDLKILRIINENGVCTLDFSESIKELADRDSEVEKLVLDAYSMSIVDNCQDVNSVTFNIEGKPYSTRNITLKDGEVYLKN